MKYISCSDVKTLLGIEVFFLNSYNLKILFVVQIKGKIRQIALRNFIVSNKCIGYLVENITINIDLVEDHGVE